MSFKILKGDNSVSICQECNHEIESFIDIYSNDYKTPSPFPSVESAYLFAVILVKILELLYEFR